MKKILCLALAGLTTLSYAQDEESILGKNVAPSKSSFSAGAFMDYNSVEADLQDDVDLGGISAGAWGQGIFEYNSQLGILGGARLYYLSLSGEKDLNSSLKVEFDATALMGGFEGGIQFKATPAVILQGTIGYNYAFSGEFNSKTKVQDFNKDMESFNYGTVNAKAFYKVPNSSFIVGGGFSFLFAGEMEMEDSSEEVDVSGFSFGLSAGVNI